MLESKSNDIYVEGIGTVSEVGELDLEVFIKTLLGMKSFYEEFSKEGINKEDN
jgi:hypothetical protein